MLINFENNGSTSTSKIVDVQKNKEITITRNGEIEITPDVGNVAMEKVTLTANVEGGGTAQQKEVTVYPNETNITVTPDEGKYLQSVVVNGGHPRGFVWYAFTNSAGNSTILNYTHGINVGTQIFLKPFSSSGSLNQDSEVEVTVSSVDLSTNSFTTSSGVTYHRNPKLDQFGYYPLYSKTIPVTQNGTQIVELNDYVTHRSTALKVQLEVDVPIGGIATLLGTVTGTGVLTIDFDQTVEINPGDWVVILNTKSMGSATTPDSIQRSCWIGIAEKSGPVAPMYINGSESPSGTLSWTVTTTSAVSANFPSPSGSSFAAYVLKARN